MGHHTSTSSSPQPSASNDFEVRMRAIEQKILNLKSQTGDNKVEEALRQVRILVSRPKLTPTHVLIAALEMLVDVATQSSHKEVEFLVRHSKHIVGLKRVRICVDSSRF